MAAHIHAERPSLLLRIGQYANLVLAGALFCAAATGFRDPEVALIGVGNILLAMLILERKP